MFFTSLDHCKPCSPPLVFATKGLANFQTCSYNWWWEIFRHRWCFPPTVLQRLELALHYWWKTPTMAIKHRRGKTPTVANKHRRWKTLTMASKPLRTSVNLKAYEIAI